MRVVIPQIAWHVRDPVLTLDFDPKGKTEQGYYRLVTGGADKLLLIWHLTNPDTIKPEIICVSELTRHQKGINVCRFSPCGNYIAAGDDDSYVFIWKNESISEREEEWNVEKIFRRHVEDVTDLCWSPDSNYLVSGSVDNTSVLWDVKKGTPLHFWSEREHTGFVQGVAYDPLGEFSATMCIDRHLRFFNNKTGKVLHKALKYPPAWLGATDDDDTKEKENRPEPESTIEKLDAAKAQLPSEPMPVSDSSQPSEDKPLSEINGEEQEVKPPPKKPVTTLNRLFHDDMLKTFCRRLSFSARGEFLIVPGGLLPPVEKKREESRQGTPVIGEEDENSKDKAPKKFDHEQNNAAIIFCRNSWTNPCAIIPTGTSYSIAARFSTVTYQRERKQYEYADPELVNSTKKCDRIMSCVGKLRPPRNDKGILLDLPYRLVYAVATNDSILIGDTASTEPLACIKNIHCTRMTDISWSPDGLVLVASSTDGYCSIITFEKNELGEEFKLTEGEFPTLTPNCFPIAPPDPKPIKKKEPKEPKEVKENELKDKKEKELKVDNDKEPGTPTENKEEKKKKPLTILKMLSSMKSSPTSSPSGTGTSSSSQRPPKEDIKTLQQSQPPLINSSPSVSNTVPARGSTPTPVAPTTPKPTFLDGWVKKTPVSSAERKPPRRVQLVSATSSSNTPEKVQSQVQPRRVQLVTLPSSSNASETGQSQVKVQTPSAGMSTNLTENKPKSVLPNTSVAAAASSPKPIQETMNKKPRRIQLVTLDDDDVKHPPAKRIATEAAVNGVQSLNENLSVAPAVKKPRRVQLITLDGDKDKPKTNEPTENQNAVNGSQTQTENPPSTASEQISKNVSAPPSGPALM